MPHIGRLRDRVAAAIADRSLWQPGDRVAVAVSGGLDSVCLLDLLVRTRGVHGAVLSVATVDHGARPGSAADLAFVRELAHDLPVHSTTVALGPEASEQALRDGRYAFLDGLDVDRVALAHHLDDQAETLILQLLRGAGSRGLGGMGWRRDRYVRPLLGVRRAELEAWAEHRGLTWREDPSNNDPRYLRNRVRAEVLPLLEDLRPGAASAIARAASHCAEDDAFLDGQLPAPADAWRLRWLLGTPAPVVRRTLIRDVPGASSAHVDAIIAAVRRGGGTVHLPGGATVRIQDGWARLDAGSGPTR